MTKMNFTYDRMNAGVRELRDAKVELTLSS